LVKTRSGNVFPRSADDWKWFEGNVEVTLEQLHKKGYASLLNLEKQFLTLSRYQLVIFSNQKKISIQKELKAGKADSKSLAIFKEKLTTIMSALRLPISVYAATEDDNYRKPRTDMWKEFVDDYDLDVVGIDKTNSIFVGDAAGRPKDHSSSDL
jgi:bifunctional polynucleotide phosphatase/kinase